MNATPRPPDLRDDLRLFAAGIVERFLEATEITSTVKSVKETE